MRKRQIIFLCFSAALIFMPEALLASAANTGTKTAQFLKLVSGARGAAMGEALTTAGDDAFAIDFNPAAIANVPYKSIAMMHALYLADTSLSYLAYAEHTGDMGAWGFALKYMNYGDIEGTDIHGDLSKPFSPYDMALSIAFSCYISGFNKEPEDRFIIGAAGKLISSKIDNSDYALSADIGLLSPWFLKRHMRISFAGQNLMGTMRFDKDENDLPMLLRFGLEFKPIEPLILEADAISYSDYDMVFAGGAELNIKPIDKFAIALRGGINTRAKDESVKGSAASFGLGIKFGDVYSFDYSLSPFGDIGDVHRFSLSINFKKPIIIKKRRRGT